MKTNGPIIHKIVLKVKGKKLNLTPDEALELYEALEKLYGRNKIQFNYPYWTYPTPSYLNDGPTADNKTSGFITIDENKTVFTAT